MLKITRYRPLNRSPHHQNAKWVWISVADAEDEGDVYEDARSALIDGDRGCDVLYQLTPPHQLRRFRDLVYAATSYTTSSVRMSFETTTMTCLHKIISSNGHELAVHMYPSEVEIKMIMQFLADNALPTCNECVTDIRIRGREGLPILRYIYNNSMCLPNLRTIDLDATIIDDDCTIPINTNELILTGNIPDTARATITSARVRTISFRSSTNIDVENATVNSVFIYASDKKIKFTGRFPQMTVLITHADVSELDLSHCPKIVHIETTRLTPEHLVQILTAAPTIPTIPFGSVGTATYDMKPILTEYAPHLLPQYTATDRGSVSWTPAIHGAFTEKRKHTIALFVAGMDRLAEETKIATFDPAALEEIIRHIKFRDNW